MIGQGYRETLSTAQAIRPLQPEDLGEVLEIERKSYSHPWSEQVFRDCFRPDYRLWAMEIGGTLVGYGVVAYMVDEAHLLNLCVCPAHRKAGLGRLLLRHLAAAAARDHMCRLLLEVRHSNREAIALYSSEGFSTIGQRPGYYPSVGAREDALVMALSLAPG